MISCHGSTDFTLYLQGFRAVKGMVAMRAVPRVALAPHGAFPAGAVEQRPAEIPAAVYLLQLSMGSRHLCLVYVRTPPG